MWCHLSFWRWWCSHLSIWRRRLNGNALEKVRGDSMTQALTIPTPTTLAQALDFAIAAWIHEKFGHTKSEKTRTAYNETITSFRQLLQREGLDLAWSASERETETQIRQRLALYAQALASTRLPGSRHKGETARATKNQRLAILSSFYQF